MPRVDLLAVREEPTAIGQNARKAVRKFLDVLGRLYPPSGMLNEKSKSKPDDFPWEDVLRADAVLPARMM